jgi:hypothetical protein
LLEAITHKVTEVVQKLVKVRCIWRVLFVLKKIYETCQFSNIFVTSRHEIDIARTYDGLPSITFSVFAFIQSVNHNKDLLEAITHKVTEVVQKLVKVKNAGLFPTAVQREPAICTGL